MNKMDIFKGIAELVVSIGVSSIVGSTIKLTTAPGTKLPKRIALGVGGVVLSSMVAEMATVYTSKKIDDYAEIATGIFTTVKLAKGTETIVVPPVDESEEPVIDYKGLIVNGELTFSTEFAAEKVKNEVVELIRQVKYATVADLYVLASIDIADYEDDDQSFGWNTVKGFRVAQSPAGYVVKTPDFTDRPSAED